MDQQKIMQTLMSLYPKGDEGLEMIRGHKVWRGVTLGYPNGDTLLSQIESIEFRPDDTIVFTYPKCGTTFVAGLVRDLLVAMGKIEEDYFAMYPLEMGIDIENMKQAPEGFPRIIITHLPWDALPSALKQGTQKMICITRNPKDTFCSMFPFMKRMRLVNEQMSMDRFLELYTTNKVMYGDYIEWHRQWLAHRSDSNILSLSFEDLKIDLLSGVQQIVQHLNYELTEEQIKLIAEKNEFETKKANARAGMELQHLRKGQAGGWKEELTAEQSAKLDAWIEEGKDKLEGFDLRC